MTRLPATRSTLRQRLSSKVGIHFTIPCIPAARMGMQSPVDAVRVCGALANLPAAPHTPSLGASSSSSQHGPLALAPHSRWLSAQAFWGAWQVMGSARVSSPSLCCYISAAEAKFCFLRSPLVSTVDREMPDLSRPGQRGRDLL